MEIDLAMKKGDCGAPSCSTPVVSWKEEETQISTIKGKALSVCISTQKVSARKLAAALWEFHHYSSMYRHLHHHSNRGDAPDHHHEPASASSPRRHITASLMERNRSLARNHHALQPLSPSSYGSSLEMAPYNPNATPRSSIGVKGRIGESSYAFKTSSELLKVLNRIWTLEEQHTSNKSLVKSLKHELNLACAKIKDLLKDRQANHSEMNELMEKISEDNIVRKNKEQEPSDFTVQSVRDELENERKLRKRSEKLHRKLARELFDLKVAFSTTVKDFEKERKSGEILEELCDEFAKGVKEFAGQLHSAKPRSDSNSTFMADPRHNLLLHISETWLDERMQQDSMNNTHKTFVVEKLRQEIEAFLSARKVALAKDPNETRIRRCSLESIPEISKVSPENYDEREEIALISGKTPPSLIKSDIETMALEPDAKTMILGEGTSMEVNILQKSEIYDSVKDGGNHQRQKAYYDEGQGSNSKTVDRLMSELLLSEKEGSLNNSWLRRDNSLKAKLHEPKTKGYRSRLRILKGS